MSLDFVHSCTHATGKTLEENHENFKIRQTKHGSFIELIKSDLKKTKIEIIYFENYKDNDRNSSITHSTVD